MRPAWEQQALDELRHGDPAAAVAAYQQQGRIVTRQDAEALREQLVADWWGAYQQSGGAQAVMVALRRADVDELNQRARTRLQTAALGPPHRQTPAAAPAGTKPHSPSRNTGCAGTSPMLTGRWGRNPPTPCSSTSVAPSRGRSSGTSES